MAKAPKARPSRKNSGKAAAPYTHPDQTLLTRPEVGTQAQFRKKKLPVTYRYDSSLSPALDWDGQNGTRELGEWLLGVIEQAAAQPAPHELPAPAEFKSCDGRVIVSVRSLAEAVDQLKRLGRPFLDWAGKAERLSFDVPALPLFVHERLSTKAIVETLIGHKTDKQTDFWEMLGDPRHSFADQVLKAYEYQDNWVNRLILGDSLVVMNSLLHYERLGGQVQMIYIDPPYGVKFGSNFQPFVRKRDVSHNDDEDLTREPEMVKETDTGRAKSDDVQWMRFTLDTVGKTAWPRDTQGRPIYPEDFEELAKKREQPLHPPGQDVRCIVSVGMLNEGWDCNTVTHIVGLRPFMSQLLCEQVVGRGLRRRTYELGEDGLMTEEVAKVFGVPFQVIPFKANPAAGPKPPQKRHHVYALPGRANLAITFPRVEGYRQAIRNRVSVDWNTVPPLWLDPAKIPPEVEVKASLPTNTGRPSLSGPGRLESIDLNPYRSGRRLQELVFEMAKDLTREYVKSGSCEAPAHVLFPQLVRLVQKYVDEKVTPISPAERVDLFLSPYYGWAIERLVESIRPDTSQGEAPEVPRYETSRGPGSTADVDYWTSKDVREVVRSHLNYVVADTKKWEQEAAYHIDTHPVVDAFVKNAGLGFAIPYLHNGQPHDYVPDFIIRLGTTPVVHLILETKGFDDLAEVKAAAAERWVTAVNADGMFGTWRYALARKVDQVRQVLDGFC